MIQFDEAVLNTIADKLSDRISEQITSTVLKRLEAKLDSRGQLPPMLTKKQLREVLQIGETKATELMHRADFPVFREAGILIPTHQLFEWIDNNTRWVKENSKFFKDAM
ncbi:hypothetical protein [Domibacillus iocasae]|uniref:Helix-turn-helix domain-containing protein n=1 Tax=Domibacillus iocasae TaxID=1714016 RepID=A0A1E7DRZ1_9BACI|nr:hypothetical protein [Domibacillus iocasae]OES45840.1 hypothetical protein BA724_03290 [Domibacillus iocasae]